MRPRKPFFILKNNKPPRDTNQPTRAREPHQPALVPLFLKREQGEMQKTMHPALSTINKESGLDGQAPFVFFRRQAFHIFPSLLHIHPLAKHKAPQPIFLNAP
jgi:hypothetical protein